MKLSDYVAKFLIEQNVKHVFTVAGGACLHLIDSIGRADGIDYVCPHHEQAAAMAAEGYARMTGNLGVALATSGPGATNLITGICCAYYDSIPVLYLSGQVSTFRFRGETGVRQLGFQETDIVEMCKSITKYAVLVRDPKRIRFELEKAVYLAKSGRPGPVLVDIPDNLQREEIDVESLEAFVPPVEATRVPNEQIRTIVQLLKEAKRPIVIFGMGIRLAGATDLAADLLTLTNLPVTPTWGALDLLGQNFSCFVGTFGLHGTRYGNFAVQNADLVVSIGSRLDTHETGSPLNSFAREAKKVIVDIDPTELGKFETFGMSSDVLVQADAREFLGELVSALRNETLPAWKEWWSRIHQWQEQFSICPPQAYAQETLNPYVFVKSLSRMMGEGDTIAIDTGCAVAWFMQAFEPKAGQRIFSALNNTPMGYALPAAVGASFATGRPVTCLIGDGGLMMNMQELATIAKHRLPVRIFVANNHGYGMIQQTQEQWLGSRYHASSEMGGLAFPDFAQLASAHGIPSMRVARNDELDSVLARVAAVEGPCLVDLDLLPTERVIPQVRYGRPLEDPEPFLKRDVFKKAMIVKPMDVSMKDLD